MPEISVLMSVYNGEEFIAESINSILNQTFTDFELIIVDDGSTDGTVDVVQSFRDKRIRLFRFVENKGVGAALKFSLSKAEGRYIAKADADDINRLDRLEKQKTFLDRNPDIELVKGFIEYFPHDEPIRKSPKFKAKKILEKEKNRVVSPEDIWEKLYWYCCIPHTTIMCRSESMKAVGYDELRICEDYKLFYHMNKKGYKMATIPEVLVHMRVIGTSITASTESRELLQQVFEIKKEEILRLFAKNEPVYIWGAGGMGRNFLQFIQEEGFQIAGFIDGDRQKQGDEILGVRVFPPELFAGKKEGCKLVVASQPGRFEIVNHLKNLGYRHLEDFVVFF